MFDTLVASRFGSDRSFRPAAVATVLHLGIIVGALSATRHSPGPAPVVRDTISLQLPLLDETGSRTSELDAPSSPQPILPGPPQLPDPELAPPSFEQMPLGLPGLDAQALSGLAFGGDSAVSSRGPARPMGVLAVSDVDQSPSLLNEIHPEYPEGLRRGRIGGAVQLEYVISQAGEVDSASIRVLRSPDPAFSASAVSAVRRARFRPARRSGQAVAVLVRQTIRFVAR